MKYTIRPKTSGYGSFSVLAAQPAEAIEAARAMIERGLQDVEILDDDGTVFDIAGLERLTTENSG